MWSRIHRISVAYTSLLSHTMVLHLPGMETMEPSHTSTARIAVFDSGIGGTSVLTAIRDRAPWADIVYVADHAFGPYGERTLDEVRDRTELLATYLDTAGIDVVRIRPIVATGDEAVVPRPTGDVVVVAAAVDSSLAP